MSTQIINDDEHRLAQLGYKQELNRSWSGFSNFAISFSIISILAGCFTTFAQAWNNGGPVAISIGWPVISAFILIIGFCLSELASAYPTSGGIYWWAAKLGGPKAGFYTGWLNLVGLLAVTASVVYGASFFLNTIVGSYSSSYATSFLGGDYLKQQFFWFVAIMVLITLANIFSGHMLALVNNVSVWWHVIGSALVILILVIAPSEHQSLSWMFTKTINSSGFGDQWYLIYVLPLGFLLTQYTITGFDASAHMSEETKGAHMAAARGIWKSIFYSAIGGYVLLMSFLYAATKVDVISSFECIWRRIGHRPSVNSAVNFVIQTGHDHFHRRSIVLRNCLSYIMLAHDVCIQPRWSCTRSQDTGQGQQASSSNQWCSCLVDYRRDHYIAGSLQEPVRCANSVLCGGIDCCDWFVPRIPDSNLVSLESWRQFCCR